MGEILEEKNKKVNELIENLLEIDPKGAMETVKGQGLEIEEKVSANEEPDRD